MADVIYQWLDLIWLPIGWFVVHRNQRLMTMLFVITCIFTLRLQVEFMYSLGDEYQAGILPFLTFPLLYRGYVVYGAVIAIFSLLAYFSKKTESIVFLAAVLSAYILAFCISMIVMLL